jgi:hypothetical protein
MTDSINQGTPEEPKKVTNKKSIIGIAVLAAKESMENPDSGAMKRLFQIALETRNFEISQLVQRNNFFMIFQGVLLAGLVQSSHTKPIVSFLVCCAGFFVSTFQVQMAAGAKFWQEYWEAALHKIEADLIEQLQNQDDGRRTFLYLFHEEDGIYKNMVNDRLGTKGCGFTKSLIMKRYSVSRIPIYVALALSTIWALLVICTMRGYSPLSIPSFVVGF